MEKYVSQSFDKNYATAWSADQGAFSYQLANNLVAYLKKNNLTVKSCLDVCCGTGEFLNYLSKQGITGAGTEVAKSMIEFSSTKYPTMNFTYTKEIFDFKPKAKFDLVTCNHDVINMIEKFSGWQEMFKNAHACLSKNGIFMFDYYTKNKLENWNEVSFEESDTIDHVRSIKKGMDNKCIINEVYYMKNNEGLYAKTFDIVVDAYFENNEIVNALKKAGFKTVELCDFSLAPVPNPDARNRVHVIAKK